MVIQTKRIIQLESASSKYRLYIKHSTLPSPGNNDDQSGLQYADPGVEVLITHAGRTYSLGHSLVGAGDYEVLTFAYRARAFVPALWRNC